MYKGITTDHWTEKKESLSNHENDNDDFEKQLVL